MLQIYYITLHYFIGMSRCTVVGIATDYGLEFESQ
jgi:hypothetical protein